MELVPTWKMPQPQAHDLPALGVTREAANRATMSDLWAALYWKGKRKFMKRKQEYWDGTHPAWRDGSSRAGFTGTAQHGSGPRAALRLARAPGQQADLGGGSGTSSERAGARADVTNGQPRDGARPTNIPDSSNARTIFTASACGAAGLWEHEACLAALTARHSRQGLAGSKVSLAAEATDSLLA